MSVPPGAATTSHWKNFYVIIIFLDAKLKLLLLMWDFVNTNHILSFLFFPFLPQLCWRLSGTTSCWCLSLGMEFIMGRFPSGVSLHCPSCPDQLHEVYTYFYTTGLIDSSVAVSFMHPCGIFPFSDVIGEQKSWVDYYKAEVFHHFWLCFGSCET